MSKVSNKTLRLIHFYNSDGFVHYVSEVLERADCQVADIVRSLADITMESVGVFPSSVDPTLLDRILVPGPAQGSFVEEAVRVSLAVSTWLNNIWMNSPLRDSAIWTGVRVKPPGDTFRLWANRNGRGRTRPFLVDFEVFGWVTLFLFVACAVLATDSFHDGVGDFLRCRSLRPGDPLFLISAVSIILLPQFALASVGGWLFRNYRIEVKIVVQRRAAEPEPPLPRVAVGPTRITSVPPLAGPS